MSVRPTFQTSTEKIAISDIADLTAGLQWFADLLPITAQEELAKEQASGDLLDPITLVDGRKNDDVSAVKPFGNITYVEGLGPLREAIAAADAFVRTAAPQLTGWYAGALQWFANGKPVHGPPDVAKLGAGGNVQLVDLAPYASWLEIETPRGIIFGAYNWLARQYGRQLSIGYGYAQPDKFGGLRSKPNNPARVPYAVPVLTIGNPASKVKPGVRTRPGAHKRKSRSMARRAIRQALKAGRRT